MEGMLAALAWEPQVKGALYVILSVLILCGSCYMILATNMGARLGFLLAGAGLFGWLATLGFIWWAYGRGPVGPDPSWVSKGLVVGNLAGASNPALKGFPKGWEKLKPGDPAVADAAPVADGILAPADGDGMFKSPADFVFVAAYEKGGDTHGPFGILNFRPFDVFHDAHYLIIQVQGSRQESPPSGGPAKAVADPTKPTASVLLLRNLGAKRLHPAVFTIASTIAFGLFCYQLHIRDKEAAARREAESERGSGRLQPVPR